MKMLAFFCLTLAAGICWMGCASQAQEDAAPSATAASTFDPGTLHPNAPPETAQFGQLVGIWDITDETIQADGSWQAGEGAEWIWYYILDGYAIQDDWIAPPRYGTTQADTLRQHGTNLRIYDPAAQRWDLAWISNSDKKLSTFTATAQGDSALVMRGTHASGNDARITFFDITDTRFEWKLEFAQEDGSWLEVYRIHAVRRR